MSFSDERCDFCERNVDPMGCDTAKTVADGRWWCGQCREGRHALYGHMTDDEIRAQIAANERYLTENPLWPHLNDTTKQPDDWRTHLRKLDAWDRFHQLRILLIERRNEQGARGKANE